MALTYDPGQAIAFWDAIRSLPGYPHGEVIRLRQMLFESDAVLRLPDVLATAGARPDSPLFVVMDATPMRRGQDDLKPFVLAILRRAGWAVETQIAHPDAAGQVHTDLEQIGRVQTRLRSGCAVLALGSGTITDIAKHACHRFEQASGATVPLVVFQTANSVSAYTSNMAPTFVDGVKRTLPSRYPEALVCDLETLRDAPYAMAAAGVGDLLAAGVSFADWYLAHSLGLDPTYSPLAESLMGSLDDTLLELAGGVRQRELEAMGALAKLIALAGLAMSLSQATTPLSGFEHVFSHVLDMAAGSRHQPLGSHGAQVALAALCMSTAYQIFLQEFDPATVDWARCFPDPAAMHDRVREAFAPLDATGRAGEECWADYALKLEAWRSQRAVLPKLMAGWPAVRAKLADRAWSPRTIRRILRAVALTESFESLQPPIGEMEARSAFLSAHWIRRRFTIGDLLFFLGWDRPALWQEIKQRSD